MAGLMSGPPAAVPSRDMPADAPADDRVLDDADAPEQATPEEQAQYDAFVKSALNLVADQGDKVLDLLDDDPADLKAILGEAGQFDNVTPPLALAATTVIVVLETIQSQGKPADDVLMHGGKEILEAIADLGEKSGEQKYSQDDLNQAWLMGLDLYRATAEQEGLVDDAALKAQFDEIVTADKEGRLGQVVPGLDKAKIREQAPDDETAEVPGEPDEEEGTGNGRVR